LTYIYVKAYKEKNQIEICFRNPKCRKVESNTQLVSQPLNYLLKWLRRPLIIPKCLCLHTKTWTERKWGIERTLTLLVRIQFFCRLNHVMNFKPHNFPYHWNPNYANGIELYTKYMKLQYVCLVCV
jgi:hypothetical protein